MRTTLTLDDDVAAALERLRKKKHEASLKDLVNDALRRGLREMDEPKKAHKPFRTRSVDVGGFKIDNLDNIAEVLAIAEGEDYK
jgi:metal-responsive CopG/Arc/MetJ family transcriptional regulator